MTNKESLCSAILDAVFQYAAIFIVVSFIAALAISSNNPTINEQALLTQATLYGIGITGFLFVVGLVLFSVFILIPKILSNFSRHS